jgi:lipopolysaccharide transport system ATP-binding protein
VDFWALKDISLQIQPGEVVGVIGPNGSGKSTFLKILSRITAPSAGRVTLTGRVGSLLEVGTGFHPELTGRENIFLNGAILGMSRREIAGRFDEIVEFSEISEFLDTPVKRYSSGMYVRLAFAVAAHLESDILLVDEVLAVGDLSFQRKCLGKMGQVSSQGRTILFVSHNLGAISRLCQRTLWFEHGRLRENGNTESVVTKYLVSGTEDGGEAVFGSDGVISPGSEYVMLDAVRVRTFDGIVTPSVSVNPFVLEVQYRVLKRAPGLRIGIRLSTHDGTAVFTSTDDDDRGGLVREPGVYVSRCSVPGGILNYGQYFVTVGCDFPKIQTHFNVDPALSFHIGPGGAGGYTTDRRGGILRLPLRWDVEMIEPLLSKINEYSGRLEM